VAHVLYEHEYSNPKEEAENLSLLLNDMHPPLEIQFLTDAVNAARKMNWTEVVDALGDPEKSVRRSVFRNIDKKSLEVILDGGEVPEDDPFINAIERMHHQYVLSTADVNELYFKLDQLVSRLNELLMATTDETIYPDANSTLRLSAGLVEGSQFSSEPITVLGEIFGESNEEWRKKGSNELDCFKKMRDLCATDPAAMTTPVCLLYSTDTVGGNSGSPLLNAKGEFVGINFDRYHQGLMNDVKWSYEYSRSVGVHARFILWLLSTYDEAQHLVNEMVPPSSLL